MVVVVVMMMVMVMLLVIVVVVVVMIVVIIGNSDTTNSLVGNIGEFERSGKGFEVKMGRKRSWTKNGIE